MRGWWERRDVGGRELGGRGRLKDMMCLNSFKWET